MERARVIPTVDIAIIKRIDHFPIPGIVKNLYYILLVQKHKEVETNLWRFPGGHVDTTDDSNEDAALRELKEETNMEVVPILTYLGSSKIADPRYAEREDKIFTSFYQADWVSGDAGKGFDDIALTKWFTINEIYHQVNMFRNPVHESLFKMIFNNYYHAINYKDASHL